MPENELRDAFAAALPPDVIAAYLFGSAAENRTHRESDVDVAVLLDWRLGRAERFTRRLELASWLIGSLHRNDVDLVVLNDLPPLFARRIVQEGRRVHCADDAADHAFRRDIQLRAADVAPFVERGRRALLERLRR